MVKNMMQFFYITFSVLTGVSTVVEYHHHWSDVFAGFGIGALTAILVAFWGGNMFLHEENQYSKCEILDVINEVKEQINGAYKTEHNRK